MGFLGNILEDFENYLILSLSEKHLKQISKRENEMLALKASLEYLRTDLVFLVKQGFEYDSNNDVWTIIKDFREGKYPGKYKIIIQFPVDYPKSHPIIRVKPLHNGDVSKHILDTDSGRICIAKREHGSPDSYWDSNMNAKGALILTYHLITNEIHSTKKTKTPIKPIEGTIFEDIKKIMKPKDFIHEFMEKHSEPAYKDPEWNWAQINHVCSIRNTAYQTEIIKFYREKKERVVVYKKKMRIKNDR